MRLSPIDFDAFQRATLALHECQDASTFARRLPQILLQVIPADHFSLLEFKLFPNLNRAKLVRKIDPWHQISPEMARFAERHLFQHPFPKYFADTGDRTALKLSDFHTVHEFRNTEAYQEYYRMLRVEWQLAVPADFGPQTVGGIGFGNKHREFTERDRLMLNLLRPHIELARRNASRWSARTQSHRRALSYYELTRREGQIANWLKAGKTNAEIAIILQSNVRTVEKHVEKILSKLRVENRTAAAIILTEGRPPRDNRR